MSTKWIQKVEQYAGLIGKVFDSLTNNSSTDAPSIRAVNEKFNELSTKMDDLPTKEHTHGIDEIQGGSPNRVLGTNTGGIMYETEMTIQELYDLNNSLKVGKGDVNLEKVVVVTQAKYNSIATKDPKTLYIIMG